MGSNFLRMLSSMSACIVSCRPIKWKLCSAIKFHKKEETPFFLIPLQFHMRPFFFFLPLKICLRKGTMDSLVTYIYTFFRVGIALLLPLFFRDRKSTMDFGFLLGVLTTISSTSEHSSAISSKGHLLRNSRGLIISLIIESMYSNF